MLNEKEIIKAIKEGQNKDVLRVLYRKILPEVTRFIRKNGGDQEQAEDVFQEGVIVFILAVKDGKFKEGNSIAAYIKAVVRNKWYDQFKSKLKEEQAIQEMSLENELEEPQLNDDQINTLQTLLKSLGEQCEKLIRMSIFSGYSYEEIAQAIGAKNDDVVKTSMYRCRKKLKAKVNTIPGLLNRLKFE